MIKNLSKYDIDCSKEKTKAVYEKRYKKNGEEYLKKVDEINIEEDLKEKQLEMSRIKEIFNNQERVRINELYDEMSTEETIAELEQYKNYNELDTYEFLNKTQEIQSFYNKMPEEVRKKYKDISKFTKEYLPSFINNTKKILTKKKENEKKIEQNNIINTTNEEIKNKIKELEKQLGENNNV